MKHDIIRDPSTQNVLKMFFECKTFDKESEESGSRNLEALVKVEGKKVDFVAYSSKSITPISI
tara:strand:- start:44 stop:232 length:189 start_codon:yes stop_codon:yes gene_type:complete